MYPYSYDPTLGSSSFRQLTATSLHTPWQPIQRHASIDHILRIIQTDKHAGLAISVEQGIKGEIEFFGDLEKAVEYEKSAYDFGW